MPCKTDAVVARTIGIDTGKNTLHLIGLDEKGAIVLREKLSRGRIAARLANVPRCLIGIEAGMATHYVARELIALGHEVKQVPPAYARPFRQGHKNDFRDAHAIAEAVQRPSTRCVPVKTDDQLDLQALHRVRSRLIGERTAVINQIRSFLLERGIPVRQGIRFLRQQLPDILERIPLRFEHNLHGERSSCTLLPRNPQRSVRSGAIDAEWCARRPCAGQPSLC